MDNKIINKGFWLGLILGLLIGWLAASYLTAAKVSKNIFEAIEQEALSEQSVLIGTISAISQNEISITSLEGAAFSVKTDQATKYLSPSDSAPDYKQAASRSSLKVGSKISVQSDDIIDFSESNIYAKEIFIL